MRRSEGGSSVAGQSRKKLTKKQQKEREKVSFILMGLILLLFSFFGGFKLGFLGIMLANVFRFFAGDAYLILAILLGIYGILVMVQGGLPKFKKARPFLGLGLIFVGLLLFLSTWEFRGGLAEKENILNVFFTNLFFDVKNVSVATNVGGGLIGSLLYSLSYFLISQIGSYLLATLLAVGGALILFQVSPVAFFENLGTKWENGADNRQARKEKREMKQAEKIAAKEEKEAQKVLAEEKRLAQLAEEKRKNDVRAKTPGELLAEEMQEAPKKEAEQTSLLIDHFQQNVTTEVKEQKPTPVKEKVQSEDKEDGEVLDFEIPQESEDKDYILPPASLLDDIKAADQSGEYKKIEKNVTVLEKTFASFGVDAKVVKASLGPAVTKFEVQPAVGVKVSKVVSLTDDIALALAAKDVRMEAPIPGKSLIGIEVPNDAVSTVSFKEIIADQPPHPDRLLEVPLGRDISGKIIYADLTKMPHLLIAGSTGSGKSVAINGIITSILMQAKPHEVKLMMVDPKMVELNVYNGIPHLLTPVVTNPKKAAQALQKVVQEMEQRYEKFAATGVRNISGYNEFVNEHNLLEGTAEPLMPFIVVIVDELADLMMVASNEVEDAIIRLAQMARAAGIHMILATQRPSVDVITGIIKANVPSRMAFAVSSGTDSRTIIDSNGAEKLLGRGDMLFLPMGENKPIRVQGAFISDHEVERVVKFVTDQREADYKEEMMVTEETETNNSYEEQDELFQEAKDLVIDMQTASVSLLQRRFRIGYNRAARMVDELEAAGVVGPSEGSKPRKVLIEPTPEDEE